MKPVLERLEEVLSASSTKTMMFADVSTLAKHLAPMVGVSAGRLRRNKQYRFKLDEHLAGQPGAVARVNARSQPHSVQRAAAVSTQLELGRVRAHRDRLAKLIEKHLPGFADTNLISHRAANVHAEREIADLRQAFHSTSEVLMLVLERVRDLGFEVDVEAKEIKDRSARPGSNLIASPPRTKWFIEWFKEKTRLT